MHTLIRFSVLLFLHKNKYSISHQILPLCVPFPASVNPCYASWMTLGGIDIWGNIQPVPLTNFTKHTVFHSTDFTTDDRISFFIYLLTYADGHLDCFCVSPTVNNVGELQDFHIRGWTINCLCVTWWKSCAKINKPNRYEKKDEGKRINLVGISPQRSSQKWPPTCAHLHHTVHTRGLQ